MRPTSEIETMLRNDIAILRGKLAAAERRAFAVEEAGCPRCGSYKSLEAKCQEAERREDAMEKLFREERRRYAAAYGCFHRDDYDAETEAKIKEARRQNHETR